MEICSPARGYRSQTLQTLQRRQQRMITTTTGSHQPIMEPVSVHPLGSQGMQASAQGLGMMWWGSMVIPSMLSRCAAEVATQVLSSMLRHARPRNFEQLRQ